MIAVAPTAHAESPSPASSALGCEASFEDRFDAATKLVYDQSPKTRPATADQRLREVWRATPLCEGETYYLGSARTAVHGPKPFGVALPESVTGLVGKSAPLVKNQVTGSTPAERMRKFKRAHPNGIKIADRRLARGTFYDCTVTAWSPTYSSAYTVRGGGEISCWQTEHRLYISIQLQSYSPYTGVVSADGGNYGTFVTKVTPFVACYDVKSYRSYAFGSTDHPFPYASNSDSSSTFASPDAYCY